MTLKILEFIFIVPVVKALLVIIIMVAMVLLLLGIDHFFHSGSRRDDVDAERLRRDVENKHDVITRDSVFHELVKTGGVHAKSGIAGDKTEQSRHSTLHD